MNSSQDCNEAQSGLHPKKGAGNTRRERGRDPLWLNFLPISRSGHIGSSARNTGVTGLCVDLLTANLRPGRTDASRVLGQSYRVGHAELTHACLFTHKESGTLGISEAWVLEDRSQQTSIRDPPEPARPFALFLCLPRLQTRGSRLVLSVRDVRCNSTGNRVGSRQSPVL